VRKPTQSRESKSSKPGGGPRNLSSFLQPRFIAPLLALITVALYWPVLGDAFLNYDDELYVTLNAQVRNGLSWEGLNWGLRNTVASNWHPITLWSHMLDVQLFGLSPWGHHLTSVLLHAANAVLLFLLLRRMAGVLGRSWLVALLFAVHPLRVESVAWIAERKDVLSGFFALLALICYGTYAKLSERLAALPKPSSPSSFSRLSKPNSYWLALFFFALGLMSKAMVVTLPFLMLLVDYWPLRRFRRDTGLRLVLEKAPFFALAAITSAVTYWIQRATGAMEVGAQLTFGERLSNALVSYCRYLGKIFWPVDLGVFYPHPGHWPIATVLIAGGCLGVLSVLTFVYRYRAPYLWMGWLWFVGALVPAIGIVQVGDQAMADRYTYLPAIGITVSIVWGLGALTQRYTGDKTGLLLGSLGVLACMVLTRRQLGYWSDSETLFRHTLQVTDKNYIAHNNLGSAYRDRGEIDEAIKQYHLGIAAKPTYPKAHYNLGNALLAKGELETAAAEYQETIRLMPNDTLARNNLAAILMKQGKIDRAIEQYQEAIRSDPNIGLIHNNYGLALLRKGEVEAAIGEFQEAIRLTPTLTQAHDNLTRALALQKAAPP